MNLRQLATCIITPLSLTACASGEDPAEAADPVATAESALCIQTRNPTNNYFSSEAACIAAGTEGIIQHRFVNFQCERLAPYYRLIEFRCDPSWKYRRSFGNIDDCRAAGNTGKKRGDFKQFVCELEYGSYSLYVK